MKLCMCGAIKGRAHAPFCPYPYYGNKTKEESAWMDAFRKMKSKSPLKLRMSGKGEAKRFAEEIIKQMYDPAYVYPAPIFPRFNCAGKVIIDEMVNGLTQHVLDGGESVPFQAESTPEVLSTSQALPKPTRRK